MTPPASPEQFLREFAAAIMAADLEKDSLTAVTKEIQGWAKLLELREQEAWQQGADAHNLGYSGKPEKHPVPCQDCGSDYWMDWTLPHPVFNAVCPGGSGYLCLPCFTQRLKGLDDGR